MEARQHAHDLLDQPEPEQLEAVLELLEVMIHPHDDTLTEQDRHAVAASREYFRQNPSGGMPFNQVVADCGFTMDEARDRKDVQVKR